MSFLGDIAHLFMRQLRNSLRTPVFLLLAFIQPLLWLVLFGQLFERAVQLPGFDAQGSYIQFLCPGLVAMSAFFGAAYSGLGLLVDLERGVMDRMLVTPVSRTALIAARILHSSAIAIPPCLLILGVAYLMGARVSGGVLGILSILLAAALIAGAMSAISHGVVLIAPRQDLVVAAINFAGLPALFVSTLMISEDLMPDWMRIAAKINPLNWAIVASRLGFRGQDWQLMGIYLMVLFAFAVVSCLLAAKAFDRYRATR